MIIVTDSKQTAPLLFVVLVLAFGVFLSVLHRAQSLAVVGPELAPAQFEVAKNARYRVVLRGRIDHPLTLGLRDADGAVLSSAQTIEPLAKTPNGARWQILKARIASKNAALSVGGGFDGDVEIRAIDDRAPQRKWNAILLFMASLGAAGFVLRRFRVAQAFALGIAYFCLLLPWTGSGFGFDGDNRYYVPTAISLAQSGDWNIDEFGAPDPAQIFKNDYKARLGKDGHWYNLYPPGTTLLCLPVILVCDWLNDAIPDVMERAGVVSALTAKFLSAATVALFLLVVGSLTRRWDLAWIIALVFALATPQFATHGGGLWSHNTSVFCAVIALGLWIWRDGRFAAWSAIPLALGFACRPTMALPSLAFAVVLLIQDRKKFAVFAALVAAGAAAFFYHSWRLWGTLLPPYYSGHAAAEFSHGGNAYFGTLVSPNRGLFVFCPVLLFAVFGGVIALRRVEFHRLYFIAAVVCFLEWIVAARSPLWWGGHCYGPRLLCELLPFAVLLLIPAWEFLEQQTWRRFALVLGIAACAWGLFVQVQALANPRVYDWNALPNVDFHSERLWDWTDWQIFATR